MSAEELPVQRDARQWKKFGACANAPGPERGITIVCDRRPVEFSWIDLTSRRFSPELTVQMKDEWNGYKTNKILPKLRAPAPTASAVPGPQSAPKTTVNQGGSHDKIPSESVAARSKQHSQVGESTSPIAPTPESQNAQDRRDDSVLKMQPVGGGAGAMSGQRKLGSFASQSTLHTEAPEFIPKGTFNPQRTTQPVQLLNNDVHQDNMPRGLGDRPFGLPDPQHGSAPNGHHDYKFGFGADGAHNFNESREMNGNAMNGDDESARRNEQLLNMKAKLKGHYRLLYSKYKEYVQKRVPEKIEEYYIRLKHCQAQYMKLKYYEYKAHAQAPNMRNNQMKGPGPSDPHPSHSSPQRPGHGGRGGVVPQNNPWTNGGGDRGGINDGYGYNSGWGRQGPSGGGDQRGFNPREAAQDFGDDGGWGASGPGRGGGGGYDRRGSGGGGGGGGGQNGHGSYSGFGGGQSMWDSNPQQSYNGGMRRGQGGGGGRRGQDRMMNDGGGNGYGDYGRPGPNDHMNGGGYGGRHGGQNRY